MQGLYAHPGVTYDLDRAAGTCEWLLANPELGGIWLIQFHGRDAGYLIVTVCVSIEFHGRFALLDELYVDEAVRGRGVGAEAVQFAAAWARARGYRAIRLETAQDNVRAQELYRRNGYGLDERYLMTQWL
jgi:ribosomal protein S18 acetylase RimI-like enzyme